MIFLIWQVAAKVAAVPSCVQVQSHDTIFHPIFPCESEFNYLGVLFSKSGNFSMAKKTQVEKATKAMFEVLKRGKINNLSIQCQLDLFDKIIKPILLYGCEAWGFSKNEIQKY
jgi:hypothetical protein